MKGFRIENAPLNRALGPAAGKVEQAEAAMQVVMGKRLANTRGGRVNSASGGAWVEKMENFSRLQQACKQ